MSLLSDAKEIRAAVAAVARDEIELQTRDCFRVKKAKVTSAPNGATCSVKFIGDDTILALPYSTHVSSVSVGSVVWVAILGNSMRNAIVWQNASLSAGGGGGGGGSTSAYATVSKTGNAATITCTDANGTTTATVYDGEDGQDGADGANGTNGTDGADGTTFTPSVSSAGVISWTNDGGKTNPESVDLVSAVIAALPSAVGVSF